MNFLSPKTSRHVKSHGKDPRVLSSIVCFLVMSCFLFGGSLPLRAADAPTGPLSLKECIDYALAHHNSVLAAESDLTGSRADARRARAGFIPRITVGSTYARSGYEGQQVGTGVQRVGTFENQVNTLAVTETFLDGGRTRTSTRQASAMRRAADADFEVARQERVLTVTTAYFEVLRARRLAEIAAQSVAEAEGQRELIQARIDTGDAAKVDVYPVEVQLANARLQRLQADNNARIAMTSLRNEVGLSGNPDLQLADVQEPSWQVTPLDDCLMCALRDRPELTRSAAQVDSARAALSLARFQRFPVPTASASYNRGLGGTGYDSQWSMGVGLNLNLFDGGAASAQVDSAKARTDSASLRDDQLGKDIATEVEEVYLSLTNAFERLSASTPNVELARQNLEVAREKYKQGLAIPLEIVTAQVSYADAQASHAQALYDCYVARAQLDKAIGKRGY